MNRVQLNSVIDRVAVVAVSYAVGAGWIAPGDEQTIVAVMIAVVSGGIALWNNRRQRIAEKAASVGMTVITDAITADKSSKVGVMSSNDFRVERK